MCHIGIYKSIIYTVYICYLWKQERFGKAPSQCLSVPTFILAPFMERTKTQAVNEWEETDLESDLCIDYIKSLNFCVSKKTNEKES